MTTTATLSKHVYKLQVDRPTALQDRSFQHRPKKCLEVPLRPTALIKLLRSPATVLSQAPKWHGCKAFFCTVSFLFLYYLLYCKILNHFLNHFIHVSIFAIWNTVTSTLLLPKFVTENWPKHMKSHLDLHCMIDQYCIKLKDTWIYNTRNWGQRLIKL